MKINLMELSNIYMNSVKQIVETKYAIQLDMHPGIYYFSTPEGEIEVIPFMYGIRIYNKTKNIAEVYQFYMRLNELATHFILAKDHNGDIHIIHTRCTSEGINSENFILETNIATLTSLTGKLASGDVISWPYPYVKATYNEVINCLANVGSGQITDYSSDIKIAVPAQNIVPLMQTVAKEHLDFITCPGR